MLVNDAEHSADGHLNVLLQLAKWALLDTAITRATVWHRVIQQEGATLRSVIQFTFWIRAGSSVA